MGGRGLAGISLPELPARALVFRRAADRVAGSGPAGAGYFSAMKAAAYSRSCSESSAVCGEAMRMAPPAPSARPSVPLCSESQAKKGWPSSRSIAWASERTCAACSDQLSDSWRDNDARSWKLRMRVRLADRLSSWLAISLSPVWVE